LLEWSSFRVFIGTDKPSDKDLINIETKII